jgi:hypothetical protein
VDHRRLYTLYTLSLCSSGGGGFGGNARCLSLELFKSGYNSMSRASERPFQCCDLRIATTCILFLQP